MRWQNRRESDNVEDRRNQSGNGLRMPGGGKGGLIILVVVVVAGYYGVDLSALLDTKGTNVGQTQSVPANSAKDNEQAKFTSVVLASTEDVWKGIFTAANKEYQAPKLILFRGSTATACGTGQSAMGPFYCPSDRSVYIDLSFYQDM